MSDDEDDQATRAVISVRSVLLVGASRELAKRCHDASARAGVLFFLECDLANLINLACERKPLVILFPEHVYAFDSAEFDALARDVQASVLQVSPELTDDVLDALLDEALLRAELLRQPEVPSSRYTVVPAGQRRTRRRG